MTAAKLNRSFSESELYRFENLHVEDLNNSNIRVEKSMPYVKKTVLIVEEVIHNSPVILRSGKSVPNQLHNIGSIYAKTSILSTSNVKLNLGLNARFQPKDDMYSSLNNMVEVTPMDVDWVCNNSDTEEKVETEEMEEDHNIYTTDRLNSLGRMLRNRKTKRKGTDIHEKVPLNHNTEIKSVLCKRKHVHWITIVLVVILVSLSSLLGLWLFQDGSKYFSDIQLQNLKKDLLENVHEQKEPVNIVIQSLEHQYNWTNKVKVLGFVGSNGVGKTFVANLLKKHFHIEHVNELYGVQLNFKSQWEDILYRLKDCCLNLVIIDDLKKNDIVDFLALVHSLPKNIYILVIPIFSIQDSDDKLNYVINNDDITEIRQEFDNANLFYELAIFHQFNLSQVKDWLEKQLKVQNIRNSEKLISNVLYNHNVSYEGLKGLYFKLLLEIEAIR